MSRRRSRSRNRGEDLTYTPSASFRREFSSIKFISEVERMMYVFGDVIKPNNQSVKLVEDYVRRHVSNIMARVIDITKSRGEKRCTMQTVLSIYHDDPMKISRLQRSLTYSLSFIRNLKEYQKRKSLLENESWKKSIRKNDHILSLGEFDEDDTFESCSVSRMKDKRDVDFPIHEKLLKLNMTSEELSNYETRCGTTFLFRKTKKSVFMNKRDYYHGKVVQKVDTESLLPKFCDWIDYQPEMCQLDKGALEVLGSIAYEAVGMIVQTALLIRKNMQLSFQDRFEVSKGIASGVLPIRKRRELSCVSIFENDGEELNDKFCVNNVVSSRRALKPSHISEALRRLENVPHRGKGLNTNFFQNPPNTYI